MPEPLKPCKACKGGIAECGKFTTESDDFNPTGEWYFVECQSCGLEFIGYNREEAIEVWNAYYDSKPKLSVIDKRPNLC